MMDYESLMENIDGHNVTSMDRFRALLNNLKPCPLCGGDAIFHEYANHNLPDYIVCGKCGKGPTYYIGNSDDNYYKYLFNTWNSWKGETE